MSMDNPTAYEQTGDPERQDLECLDAGREDNPCEGTVDWQMPLSGTGKSFPRCEKHWEARLKEQDRINERYGGVAPPSDFDPTYAGERWDEEY